jgi:hypothetical protein
MKQSKIKSVFNATKIASIVDTVEEEIFYLSRGIIIDHYGISDLYELSKEQATEIQEFMQEAAEEKYAHGLLAVGINHCLKEWKEETGMEISEIDEISF